MNSVNLPVTAALERRLLAELHSKRLLVWLDADGAFTDYVDSLVPRRNELGAGVLAFRGSFLELMLALRDEASTLDKPPLVVHLPGFNTESVRKTPALEVYEAATRFEVRLSTLVKDAANGRFPLAEIEAFVAQPALSLAAADSWLSGAGSAGQDTHAAWVSTLEAPALLSHLTATAVQSPAVDAALRHRALTLFGTADAWFAAWMQGHTADAVIAWLLCVEYVHDLRGAPKKELLKPLLALPGPTVKRCKAEAVRLRRDAGEAYRRWADTVEAWLGDEESHRAPQDLGQIDTFRFESLCIYNGAVRALGAGEYAQVLGWAESREDGAAFWEQQEQPRRLAWQLISAAGRLGLALEQTKRPLEGAVSLEDALGRYAEGAAEVDRLQRRFEQRHTALYGPTLPQLAELDAAIDRLREAYSAWASRLASDFNTLCRTNGALPSAELQQRTLFDQAVAPLLNESGKVALFVIDAFRYEMALDLREELKAAGVACDLRARFAELPTITSVGMNALAPVARDGRLSPVLRNGNFQGFRVGESTVATPADRVKTMGGRAGGRAPLAFSLDEFRSASPEKLKRQVAQASLVVVHSTELDSAGESGFGADVFERILRDVASARTQLEAAGIAHFVFTSDHGFLLGRRGRGRAFGARGQASRRHAFSDVERADAGFLTLPLAALGYEGQGFLVFRDDTDEFNVGRPPSAFTHGGNSLQERVIPVLKVSRARPNREVPLRYALLCEPASGAMGVHRLKVRVTPRREEGQAPLAFASSQPVDVGLRVPERPEIRVVIKSVVGPGGGEHSGALRLDAATGEWTEVFFELEGSAAERLPVELVLLTDATTRVRPDTLYTVSFKTGGLKLTLPQAAPIAGWAERLSDPDAGKVFDYLERHGALTEAELVGMLGNARKARSFSARFDEFRKRLTFDVQVSMTADGKRYEKIGASHGAQ